MQESSRCGQPSASQGSNLFSEFQQHIFHSDIQESTSKSVHGLYDVPATPASMGEGHAHVVQHCFQYPRKPHLTHQHCGSQTLKITVALQQLSVKGVVYQVWVVFSDAEETSRTRTDTRLSWFPKRCRFGASPSVMTIFSTHDGPSKKSVTARLFMCVHVCDKCLCISACGWRAIRLGVCIIDFDMCVEREWVF